MMDPWDFTPFCPLRPGQLCNYKCGLALRINDGNHTACAFAVSAAAQMRGCGLNVVRVPVGRDDDE